MKQAGGLAFVAYDFTQFQQSSKAVVFTYSTISNVKWSGSQVVFAPAKLDLPPGIIQPQATTHSTLIPNTMNSNPQKFAVNKAMKAYASGIISHFSTHELLPGQLYYATSIGESHLVVAGLKPGAENMYVPINSTQCWSRVNFLPEQPDATAVS